MFVAGLELDLDDFLAQRRDAVVFGTVTFLVPMVIGTAVIALMGFELLERSCWRRAGYRTHWSRTRCSGVPVLSPTER